MRAHFLSTNDVHLVTTNDNKLSTDKVTENYGDIKNSGENRWKSLTVVYPR